jgi:four helix bundle protein
MEEKFSFEDLEVWQEAVDFADRCLSIVEKLADDRKHYRLIEQFESACTSVSLNTCPVK